MRRPCFGLESRMDGMAVRPLVLWRWHSSGYGCDHGEGRRVHSSQRRHESRWNVRMLKEVRAVVSLGLYVSLALTVSAFGGGGGSAVSAGKASDAQIAFEAPGLLGDAMSRRSSQ